jgi:hypothetical protein
MKLTEAVERGRTMIEPMRGNDLLLPEVVNGEECGRYGGCYRGMAVVGAGVFTLPVADPENFGDDGLDLSDYLKASWPWSVRTHVGFPCGCYQSISDEDCVTVAHVLAHLWDHHVILRNLEAQYQEPDEAARDPWTFERITDWLRTIEPADTPPAA